MRLAALALALAAALPGFAAAEGAPPEGASDQAFRDSPLRGLCGDHRLGGRLVEPIEGPGWCGIPLPVRISQVLNVRIEPAVTVNCRTARALAAWVERGPARAAPRMLDASLAAVRTSGSYACRTRNFRPGGSLSEHAAGNAIDLTGFVLGDGREVSILGDWRDGGAKGAWLLAAWRAACGPFGTVLGPDHDAQHRDHLHLDTASRTAGPSCR